MMRARLFRRGLKLLVLLTAFALLFTGSSLQRPLFCARQTSFQGHASHKGAPFGRHTVAPSSISAWLKAPALFSGIISNKSFSIAVRTDAFMISASSSVTRDMTRSTFPSTAGTGMPNAIDAMAPAV